MLKTTLSLSKGRLRKGMAAGAVLAIVALPSGTAQAQDEPKPIGPFVLDVRGTFPRFVADPQLALSRGLNDTELPGMGVGADAGAHVYLFKWKVITFGVGAQVTLGRSHSAERVVDGVVFERAVTEQFRSLTPQLSFNFGTGDGWSYISGGMGRSQWLLVPDGQQVTPADEEVLTTINYGGGARWFVKPHLAFTFDVRFHAIYPGTPQFGRPGSPRSTMLIVGAGISVK